MNWQFKPLVQPPIWIDSLSCWWPVNSPVHLRRACNRPVLRVGLVESGQPITSPLIRFKFWVRSDLNPACGEVVYAGLRSYCDFHEIARSWERCDPTATSVGGVAISQRSRCDPTKSLWDCGNPCDPVNPRPCRVAAMPRSVGVVTNGERWAER